MGLVGEVEGGEHLPPGRQLHRSAFTLTTEGRWCDREEKVEQIFI